MFFILVPNSIVIASQEEAIKEQQEEYKIQDFLNNSKKYMGDAFENINIKDVLQDAIDGEVDNSSFLKIVFRLLGKEVVSSIRVVGSILVIIVIHSILKAISESLENDGISKLIYYVQYILIVTIIMTSFTDIVKLVQDTTNNLIGFMNLLVPLLITLMMSTGSITTSGILEPIILFAINFMGNIIQNIIIPLMLIFTSLVIISKISDNIKIDKLSKMLKSGVVWFLGIVLTIFVGIISLEGTMSSSVDRNNSKNNQSSCKYSNTGSRKNIRRCSGYCTSVVELY